MEDHQKQLDALKDIRNMMERSARFRSLSSLTGWLAGLLALAGILFIWWKLDISPFDVGYYEKFLKPDGSLDKEVVFFLIVVFSLVFLLASAVAIYLAKQKANELRVPAWDVVTRRMFANLALPMVAGGLFCLSLIVHGVVAFIAPASLIFYGLALINASKYTIEVVRYLGLFQLFLGLLFSFIPEFGLLGWVVGFCFGHIMYGFYLNKDQTK